MTDEWFLKQYLRLEDEDSSASAMVVLVLEDTVYLGSVGGGRAVLSVAGQ